jgi:hypothetical protein
MLGEWQAYADSDTLSGASTPTSRDSDDGSGGEAESREPPGHVEQSVTKLSESPTIKEVKAITKRMYDQTAARRRLGMRASEIVRKSFSGERYLREHEQMLWVGKAKKDMRCASAGERLLTHEAVPAHIDAIQTNIGAMDEPKDIESSGSSSSWIEGIIPWI